VIIMTAYASVETAVRALKEGAYDYITKPFDPDHLAHLVRKTAERRVLRRENLNLRQQLALVVQPTPIVGHSPSIKRVLELIATVAPTETTVLITGESGTGKELVARAIHASSPRAYMPLVVVNCGALPEGTLESELFGHERGAFTGAQYRHKGKFELAHGGTLFLDEIAEVSPKIQVELLRVLEEKKVTRLGGTQSVEADFRTVAATNKRLRDEVKAGRFREDLYYRLNVFHIELPPLRERRDDIPELAKAFVERLARAMNRREPELTKPALAALCAHDWPGNVRELANAIERAMVVRRDGPIRAEDLPILAAEGAPGPASSGRSLAEVERVHVERVLAECDWNISQAARLLDVDRATVYHKIKQYGLVRS
jgi:two-component system response regulator HydG